MFGTPSASALCNPAASAAQPWERAVGWRPSGWAPRPAGQHDSDQTGYYGDAILSTTPARWEGAQLWCGRESQYPGWQAPPGQTVPLFFQTQQRAYLPGAQRYGGNAGDLQPAGPLASRKLRQSVLEAQVAQSGLQVMGWAQQIKQWS
jgi:hypothetical protein